MPWTIRDVLLCASRLAMSSPFPFIELVVTQTEIAVTVQCLLVHWPIAVHVTATIIIWGAYAIWMPYAAMPYGVMPSIWHPYGIRFRYAIHRNLMPSKDPAKCSRQPSEKLMSTSSDASTAKELSFQRSTFRYALERDLTFSYWRLCTSFPRETQCSAVPSSFKSTVKRVSISQGI